jgi:hypothetical protein
MSEEQETVTAVKGKRGRPRLDRKPAPDVSIVEEVYKDPRQKKIDEAWRLKAKEEGWNSEQLAEAKKKWHLYFSLNNADPDTMESEGYIPFEVLKKNSQEKKQVLDRGDRLWMKDAKEAQRAIDAPGRMATEMLSDTLDANSDKYRTEFDKNPE